MSLGHPNGGHRGYRADPSLVVGFDLDLTLVDSALGIAETVAAVAAEIGLDVDHSQVWPLIGAPLEHLLAVVAPGHDLDRLVQRYRELYPSVGVPTITLLPGAAAAVQAVAAAGGVAVVVSTKVEAAIRAVLVQVDLLEGREIAAIAGGGFGADKGPALRALGAGVFVGDHPGDIVAARAARAYSVAVATGPFPAEELTAADVVLPDLTYFADWLGGYIARPKHHQHR